MTGLIIGVLIYLVSVWGAYKFFQLSYYHPKGEDYGNTPYDILLIPILVPFFNSIITLMMIVGAWKEKWFEFENFLKPKHNKWKN